jgi:murein tripeptide amidase MpaA
MEVGDSFVICHTYSRDLMSKFGTAARNWANRRGNGWKFALRKVEEGIRVWRTD